MITIEGTIEEIIYCNEENGYTVCELKCSEDKNSFITAVGYMPFINPGESLRITGKWVKHPDYGDQLKVEIYEKVLPKTADELEKYLGSGVIKGVGPATAARIVEQFGENTIEVIQFNPEKLSLIKGISLEKALRIGQAFDEQRGLREVVMFFQHYGISPNFSTKIYKIFGVGTIEQIKANPYKLADEVIGIGFKTADTIASSLGIDPSSRFRICSGIKYILSQAASNGHTYYPESILKQESARLLQVDIDSLSDAFVSLVLEKVINIEKNMHSGESNVYLCAFYNAELGVSKRLVELSSAKFSGDLNGFDDVLLKIQKEEGLELAEMQKIAVREALLNGVLVITGGPGTGKTTIIKTIIRLLQQEGFTIVLTAPTGRAAKRMTTATGYEAKTIHRLLEIGYLGNESEPVFMRNEANTIDAHAVIIDETSMVDIILMNNLLKAIAPGTRLIIVGDADQLPSVGAGNVLKDMIYSSVIKTVRLTEIFRQAEESMIVVNAHRINKGEQPILNCKEKDFFFIPRSTPEAIVNTIVDLCARRLPSTYNYDPIKHIQILTPTRKGPIGVTNMNIELQKVLNPPSKRKAEKQYRDYNFREGDRIMQIKNNYNLRWMRDDADNDGMGVFNGDSGIISMIDANEQKLLVKMEDDRAVEYDYSILDEIEPAYAVTVHKSQGSEFPVVIMPMYPGPQVLMTRNLLYTAVTRARKMVILVGVENTLKDMIDNERETLRYSGLANKFKAWAETWE